MHDLETLLDEHVRSLRIAVDSLPAAAETDTGWSVAQLERGIAVALSLRAKVLDADMRPARP